MYKLSHYNFYIPVPEKDRFILYNSFQNSLFDIENEYGESLRQMESSGNPDFSMIPQAILDELINEGFVVTADKDECGMVNDLKHRFYQKNRDVTHTLGFTFLVTNACNLACVYCFEGLDKPLKVMDDETFGRIYDYIEKEIKENDLKSLSISWYGGEPMLHPLLIEKFSEKLIKLCDDNKVNYNSGMISNGVNMSKRNVEMLVKARVSTLQITLDGGKKTHDLRRPFVNSDHSSFDIIMDNLSNFIGQPIQISIRVNIDKQVFPSLGQLFDELIAREIWPHNRNFIIYLGFTQGTSEYQDEQLYTSPEFTEALFKFRNLKLDVYNKWAEKNGQKKAKLALKYPTITHNVCSTYNAHSAFVIDAFGNISKCWEHVNSPDVVVGKVSDGIENVIKSDRYLNIVNNFVIPAECGTCKVYPICDERFCPDHNFSIDGKKKCLWKHQLEHYMKYQYLMQLDNPDMVESFESYEQKMNNNQKGASVSV